MSSLFIFIALMAVANAGDLAGEWCGRTTRKANCLSIVGADPRADLKTSPNGIAAILRDKSSATAAATSAKISALLKRATNKHEISSLKSCSDGYKRAISRLKSADFKVVNRDTYGTLIAAISDANDEPRDCELSFQEPPAVPSPITAENNWLREICATTLEIVNLAVCNSPSFC